MAGEGDTNRIVKIHEITKISPSFSDNSEAEECCLPLTLFDTFWLKFRPVERLFFYETNGDLDQFNSHIIPKLKHSLSLTLGLHYLPLAGHIILSSDSDHNPKASVYYFPDQNDGVSFTVAEYSNDDDEDDSFNHLSGNGIREAVKYRPLTPQLAIKDDKAEVVAVQITLFPNQGFCIGISTHHAFFDGKSSVMFIKSWASLCKQHTNYSLPPELIPSFDRTVIKDPKGVGTVFVKNWIDFTGGNRSLEVIPSFNDFSKSVRGTVLLTRADIQKLREKVLLECNNNKMKMKKKKLNLSTFVLTCAYTFTCLVKSKGGETDSDILLVFAADYRARLDPPVPNNYFGNCVWSHFRMLKAGDFTEPAGGSVSAVVAETLSDMVEEIGDGISTLDDGLKDEYVNNMSMVRHVSEKGGQSHGVAGSPRFDVYGSDFGWGRPKKVEIVSIDATGAIALAESRDGDGGVEVGVVLEKHEMEIFASLFHHGLN